MIMIRKAFPFLLGVVLLISGCHPRVSVTEEVVMPADQAATLETVALFRNLQKISSSHILFGHQDALAYGVGRRHDDSTYCDIKDVTGAFPAVYGWDIGHIAFQTNVDSIPFPRMIDFIKEAYRRGGIITISWHEMKSGREVWSSAPRPSRMLPGGDMHEEFMERLNLVAEFFRKLTDDLGTPIPVIFRPFHEHNGDWFWWGTHNSTPEEYIALWRFTVDKLRHDLKINHLLYAISPDRSRMKTAHNPDDFLYAYPGDDYVDILGLDNYWDVGRASNYTKISRKAQDSLFILSLKTLVEIAESRNKIPALTETGLNALTEPDWYTSRILNPIKSDPTASRIAWVLVWRNAWPTHFYAPYPGHKSQADFIDFYKDEMILFEDRLPSMYNL
jgi:mannan endo-1,4-beta-mannosidase